MNILLFSDLHAHNWPHYSVTLDNGRNSRFQTTLNVLDQIKNYCTRHFIPHVVFGGDMFHTRNRIVIEVFNDICNKLNEFHQAGITMSFLPGNHDQTTKLGDAHALEAFKQMPGITVMDEFRWYTHEDGLAILACPYTDNADLIKETMLIPPPASTGFPIAMLHAGIQGAKKAESETYPDEDLTINDISNQRSYIFAFTGHYHIPQQLKNGIIYMGSPNPTTWGDPYMPERGFVIADLVERKFKRIPAKAPQFIKLDIKEMLQICEKVAANAENINEEFIRFDQNIIKVISDEAIASEVKDAIREVLKQCRASFVEFEDKFAPLDEEAPRTTILPTMEKKQMVGTYVDEIYDAKRHKLLDPKRLKSIGNEIMDAVTQRA